MEKVFTKGASEGSRDIRTRVFIEEQGFREEFDAYDDYVDTLTIYDDNGEAIATGRLYESDTATHTYKLGRIAVDKAHRGTGLGRVIIDELEARARVLGARRYYISAQVVASPFYTKCGYVASANTHMEEHVLHVDMYKDVE